MGERRCDGRREARGTCGGIYGTYLCEQDDGQPCPGVRDEVAGLVRGLGCARVKVGRTRLGSMGATGLSESGRELGRREGGDEGDDRAELLVW